MSLVGSLTPCNCTSLVAHWLRSMIFMSLKHLEELVYTKTKLCCCSSPLSWYVTPSVGSVQWCFQDLAFGVADGEWRTFLWRQGTVLITPLPTAGIVHLQHPLQSVVFQSCCLSVFCSPNFNDTVSFSLLELNWAQQSYTDTEVCP